MTVMEQVAVLLPLVTVAVKLPAEEKMETKAWPTPLAGEPPGIDQEKEPLPPLAIKVAGVFVFTPPCGKAVQERGLG